MAERYKIMFYRIRKFIVKNEIIYISILLVLILILFFSKAIFNDFSLVPAETIYHVDNLYKGAPLPQNIRGNSILFDLTFQMYPWAVFTTQSIKEGFVPRWNPYSLAGLPYLANHQSSIFELTKLISYLFSVSAKNLLLFISFLTLFLTSLFTYLFARNLSIRKTGSLISGFAFAFSGPLIVWLGYPLTTTVFWLPLLLLASDKVIKTNKSTWITLLSLGIGLQFFGGNPEISLFILLVTGLFVVFRFGQNRLFYKKHRKKLAKKFLLLLLALVVGLLIASPQLIPTTRFILQSEAVKVGRGGVADVGFFEAVSTGQWMTWRSFKEAKQSLEDVILLVFPDFFGNPASGQYWKGTNYNESANYIGIIPLIFSLFAVFWGLKRKDSDILFWTVIAFTAFFIALHFPIFYLAAFLPILKATSLNRLRFVFVFALAILAGYGADCFFRGFSRPKINKTLDKIIKFNFILISIIIFISGTVFIWKKFATFITQEFWAKEKIILLFIFLLSNLIFFAFIKYKKLELSYVRIFFVVLIVGELFCYGRKYHPAIPKDLVYPKTESITFLRENIGSHRLTSYKNSLEDFSSSLLPNSSVIWGLQDIRGYEVLLPRRYEIFQGYFAGEDSRFTYKSFNQKVFDLLGVKYFIQGKDDSENMELELLPNLSLVYSDDFVNVYENKTVMPRAFVSFNVYPVEDCFDAIDVFASNNFDSNKVALVEADVSFTNSPTINAQEAKITRYSPNEVEILTDTKKDGFLVLTDSYYPDWKAYIDDQETKIYPADIAFRGLFLPKGQHRVVFRYH